MDSTPSPPQVTLPTDPTLASQQATAQNQQLAALQVQTQGDTASLLARYGMRQMFAGMASGSPLVSSAASTSLAK